MNSEKKACLRRLGHALAGRIDESVAELTSVARDILDATGTVMPAPQRGTVAVRSEAADVVDLVRGAIGGVPAALHEVYDSAAAAAVPQHFTDLLASIQTRRPRGGKRRAARH